MTFKKGIAKRIKEVRGERSQREFAEQLGIAHQLIANYEAQKNFPSFDTLRTLAKVEKINLHWLITGNGDMLRQ